MTNTFSISTQAQSIISKAPFVFPERTSKNLISIRAETKAFIEPSVRKTMEIYQTKTIYKKISGINCLIVRPKKLSSDLKIFYGFCL